MSIAGKIRQNFRPLVMIVAMCCGIVLHSSLSTLDAATNHTIAPSLIFLMLFVTFCKVRVRDLRFSPLHLWMLLFQIIGAVASYYIMLPLGEILAQGTMILFITPIAMGAVVIGGLLGANVTTMVGYTLICNFVIAIVAPYLLATYGNGLCTFYQILEKVVPILILPFFVAQTLKLVWHKAADWVGAHGIISFYLWLGSLLITLGRTTTFVLNYDGDATIYEQVGLAVAALIACATQFSMGRYIGGKYGDAVCGGQSLGQKNTVLSVWLAQSFLTPISSIAPTAYIIWQNLANSLQLYLHDRKARE
ncbi:MAG: transporter [Rikenellaceae bacterium]